MGPVLCLSVQLKAFPIGCAKVCWLMGEVSGSFMPQVSLGPVIRPGQEPRLPWLSENIMCVQSTVLSAHIIMTAQKSWLEKENKHSTPWLAWYMDIMDLLLCLLYVVSVSHVLWCNGLRLYRALLDGWRCEWLSAAQRSVLALRAEDEVIPVR